MPARGATSGDYLQYIVGSTDWDVVSFDSFAFDGFETGGSSGSWLGSWTYSGSYSVTTYNPHQGSRCLRLLGDNDAYPGDGYAQRAVDLSGSTGTGPYLYFWARLDDMEDGNTVEVRVSTDGSDWDTLEIFDHNDDDAQYHQHWYDLSIYGRPSTLYVSFKMNGDHSSDTLYVDNVQFSEFQGTAPGQWPMPPFNPQTTTQGSGSDLQQVLEWDFEDAGYDDVAFTYGETRTMSFQAQAALTEGTYCNKIWVSSESSGDEGQIVSSTTAKIVVGDPEETNCDGGLLKIEKVSDPTIIYPYQETTVTYTITIENIDTVPVRIYEVEDWLPSSGSTEPSEGFIYKDDSAHGYIIGRDSLPVLFYDPFNRPDSNTVSYWTDSDGSGSNVAISSDSVRLTTPLQDYYGNQFLTTGTSSIGGMTSSSYRTSLRFTAQSSQTVTKIRVYLETEAGTSPTYRYGLRSNSYGDPSSSWLGATQHGYGDLAATTTGWQTISLQESVSLTAGNTYHIVVQYQSGTINSSNYIALRRGAPQNQTLPYDGASDSNSNTLFRTYDWSTQDYQPIYLLETVTPAYEGNPCETYTSQSVYGTNYVGEKLTVSGGDQLVDTIGFYVRKNSLTSPNDHLYYQIRDATDAVVSSGTLVAKTAVTTTYSWYNATLASPLNLANGAIYRVNLYSTNSNSSYYYQVLRTENTNDSAYNGRNYNGTGSVYCSSANGGSSWTDSNQYDIPFRLRASASITQYNISTTGYTGIALSYQWRGYYTESSDLLKVEWKPSSSGTWNTLVEHPLNYTGSWQNASHNLSSAADDTQIDIRFTGITDQSDERARVDNVQVGCSVPTDITPVCMPDETEDWYFFEEHWEGGWPYYQYRWSLSWDFTNYPDSDDGVWDVGGLCSGYPYADYNPYIELQPGEIFEIIFQAVGTLTYSGSYYNEVFVKIYDGYYWDDDEWLYSGQTGTVIVPQYDLQAETLNTVLRANATLGPEGTWWRSWHWWWHR